MQFFQTFRKLLVMLNFTVDIDQKPFSAKLLPNFLLSFFSFIGLFVYLICVANGFKEYIKSIYMTIVGLSLFIVRSSLVFKMTQLYDFLDLYEHTVNESEYILIYWLKQLLQYNKSKYIWVDIYRCWQKIEEKNSSAYHFSGEVDLKQLIFFRKLIQLNLGKVNCHKR